MDCCLSASQKAGPMGVLSQDKASSTGTTLEQGVGDEGA